MSTTSPGLPQHPWFQNNTFRLTDPGSWPTPQEQTYVPQDAAASQAIHETETGGGSSYNLDTGAFVDPHWGDEPDPSKPDEFIVGGEKVPGTRHRNPTVTLAPGQFGHDAVVNGIWNAMTVNSENRRAHFGTWREQANLDGGGPNPRAGLTDLDVSGKYADEAEAVALGDQRREREIFATNPGRGITTPYGRIVRRREANRAEVNAAAAAQYRSRGRKGR